MSNKKLGQEPAFPPTKEIQELNPDCEGYNVGMSKRFYAACKCANSAYKLALEMPLRECKDILGLSKEDNWNSAFHFQTLVVKLQYILADELLKQENE